MSHKDGRTTAAVGFTLVELLIAMGLALGMLAALAATVAPTHRMFVALSEGGDVQQRSRVLVDTLRAELAAAVAPIRPYVYQEGEPPAFRSDAVTLVGSDGAARTFRLRVDDRAGLFQVVRVDAGGSAFPVLDDVVALTFTYMGDPQPPRVAGAMLRDGRLQPVTTYGPAPPPLEEDDPGDAWGAGENCLFRIVNGMQAPALVELGPGGVPVVLDAGLLADGPWCPDASSERRYDADLLRVRRVEVRVRVQAAERFRGPSLVRFARPGRATDPASEVPDQEIRFAVAVRAVRGD